MEIVVLGSGSTGNATLVSSGGTTVLLEAGFSAKQIAHRARQAGYDPDEVSAVFVSHAHADHIRGAPVFSKRHRVPTFMSESTYEALLRRLRIRRRAQFYASMILDESGSVEIGAVKVRSFPVPHDAEGTVGYVVEAEGLRFGYVTDLGHATALVVERLKGCDGLLIEMNHDPDLLRESPYPWSVKQRIASRHGHLSNEQGARLLQDSLGSDTRLIVLGHLSEVNNQPALAMISARVAVERMGRSDVRVVPAEPHAPSPAMRL